MPAGKGLKKIVKWYDTVTDRDCEMQFRCGVVLFSNDCRHCDARLKFVVRTLIVKHMRMDDGFLFVQCFHSAKKRKIESKNNFGCMCVRSLS